MNNFLIIRFKNTSKSVDYPPSLFEPYLVANPSKTKVWHSRSKNVFVYNFQVNHRINRKSFYADEEAAIAFDGFPLLRDSHGVSDHSHRDLFLRAKQSGDNFLTQIYGEFALAFTDEKKILVTTNLGGSHMVYYTENNDFVAISNRSPLLMAIPSVSCELSIEASCSACYQGYIDHELTPFRDIRKIMPGSVALVDTHGHLHIQPLKYSQLLDQDITERFMSRPQEQFEKISESIIQYLFTLQSYYNELPFTVPLSGGKDSRLILALLLKAGLKDKLQSIWTRGPLYSPDVIAAQDLCKAIDYADHEIRRPAVISNNQVNIGTTFNSINYNEGNLSLYDFQGISNNDFITISGHQNALRPGSFSTCRTTKLEYFINDSIGVRFHDPLGILKDQYRNATRDRTVNFFLSCHEEGAPISDLGDLYYLRQRNPNWVSVVCNSDRYSGPFTNPLLIGDVYRFILSVPKVVRDYELLHFLCMRYCEPRFLKVPFANQQWKTDITGTLKSLGIKTDFAVSPPYKSHKSFPNMANPYISSIKIDYLNALKPVIVELLGKHHRYYSEFMHVNRFVELLENAQQPTFRDLYSFLGVYANVLVKEYAPRIFKRDNRQAIIEDIESMMKKRSTTVPTGEISTKPAEEMYARIIERHEDCIAQLVRQAQQNDRNKIPVQRPTVEMAAAQSKAPDPSPSRLWRHVYITNGTSGDKIIYMIIEIEDLSKSRKTPFKKLVSQEEFKYGFQDETGKISLFFKGNDDKSKSDQCVQSVVIKSTQFKYLMRIDPVPNPAAKS